MKHVYFVSVNLYFSYVRLSNEQEIDPNLRPQLDIADVKHTQTESLSSNDAAVNTGKFSKKKGEIVFRNDMNRTSFFDILLS